MAKRDYSKEYEKEKFYKKKITITVTPKVYEEFKSTCERNKTSMNAILKYFVTEYIAEN